MCWTTSSLVGRHKCAIPNTMVARCALALAGPRHAFCTGVCRPLLQVAPNLRCVGFRSRRLLCASWYMVGSVLVCLLALCVFLSRPPPVFLSASGWDSCVPCCLPHRYLKGPCVHDLVSLLFWIESFWGGSSIAGSTLCIPSILSWNSGL